MVTAYLMAKQKLSLVDALAMVRDKRPVARPNDGFLHQLRSFEKSIQLDGGFVFGGSSSTPGREQSKETPATSAQEPAAAEPVDATRDAVKDGDSEASTSINARTNDNSGTDIDDEVAALERQLAELKAKKAAGKAGKVKGAAGQKVVGTGGKDL